MGGSRRGLLGAGVALAVLLLSIRPAVADYKDDVAYNSLQSELGAAMPDGTAVPVAQVEAPALVGSDWTWLPNPGDPEFSDTTITDVSGAVANVFSGHATSVGRRFFGNATSTTPGIDLVLAYRANHWIGAGFLRIDIWDQRAAPPLASPSRVGNHSWIGSIGQYDLDALARLDWVIARDEMVQAVGFTGSSSSPLLSSAYNVIAVNKTSAPTDSGSVAAGGIYTAGRTKPDIVAPENTTSAATPRVASAAALLIEAAHANPAWSTDPAGISATNRNGDVIYNAERVEVIRAALMAGASRQTSNSTSTDIVDYRVDAADRTANGLDRRFGAGQLNISNSYRIIAAGEQNSIEDYAGGGGLIGSAGFDFDPAFGGSKSSNSTATYYLAPTSGPARLIASLAWNVAIDGGTPSNFDGSAALYNLDLMLYDVTNAGNWVLVGSSTSSNENTENLWQLVEAGRAYALRVQRGAAQAAFNWDYGLAWQLELVAPLAVDSIVLADAYYYEEYPPQTLTASHGQAPYSWSIVAGSLPIGMTLSRDGVVSGIPFEITTASFTVQVTDAAWQVAILDLQIDAQLPPFTCSSGCHAIAGF